jgi:hypothetical protein
VSFTFRCALYFVDTYAHTLFLEVNSIFQNSLSNSVQNTDIEHTIYRLQETSKTAEIRTLSIERPDGK